MFKGMMDEPRGEPPAWRKCRLGQASAAVSLGTGSLNGPLHLEPRLMQGATVVLDSA